MTAETKPAKNAIALDAMGGDNMPEAAISGALQAINKGIAVVLVGDEARLTSALAAQGHTLGSSQLLQVQHAADAIGMTDHATDVRRRKDSSIMVAMKLVKEGQAAACVSMGHSGATMAAALFVLGRLKGVERPAILANIPTRTGFSALIDAGANADCRARHLQQFAVMGSLYARDIYGLERPSVGLMSIGEEEEKGNELSREAFGLLKTTENIHFYGNVEGRDLLRGTTDVIVCDGFTGNVTLKVAEGEAKELFRWIREALTSSGLLIKLAAKIAKPALRKVADKLDPAEYGAQPLLGVRGYAFIGHGSADARAVASALNTAQTLVQAKLLEKIVAGVEKLEPQTV